MAAVGFLLSQLGFVTARRFRETLEPVGLEPRQFLVLRQVGLGEGRSQHALAEAVRIPASRMVAVLDDLEHRGLVERRPHPSDRRARALYLTDDGRATIERALRLAFEFEASLTSSLRPEEREQLLVLLGRLAAHHLHGGGDHAASPGMEAGGC